MLWLSILLVPYILFSWIKHRNTENNNLPQYIQQHLKYHEYITTWNLTTVPQAHRYTKLQKSLNIDTVIDIIWGGSSIDLDICANVRLHRISQHNKQNPSMMSVNVVHHPVMVFFFFFFTHIGRILDAIRCVLCQGQFRPEPSCPSGQWPPSAQTHTNNAPRSTSQLLPAAHPLFSAPGGLFLCHFATNFFLFCVPCTPLAASDGQPKKKRVHVLHICARYGDRRHGASY